MALSKFCSRSLIAQLNLHSKSSNLPFAPARWISSTPPSQNPPLSSKKSLGAESENVQKEFTSVKPTSNSRLSYFHMSDVNTILTGNPVGRVLAEQARLNGSRTILFSKSEGITKTRAELHQDTNKLAAGLVALGVHKGDRVGIWGLNIYSWLQVYFAAVKIGAIAVLFNPAYKQIELEYTLAKSGCKVFFMQDQFKVQNFYKIFCATVPEVEQFQAAPPSKNGSTPFLSARKFPKLKHVVMLRGGRKQGALEIADLIAAAGPEEEAKVAAMGEEVQADDPLMIQFTSGTTGFPKGAVLSHHNALNAAIMTKSRLGILSGVKASVAMNVPFFHSFGTVVLMNTLTTSDGKLCIPDEYFNSKLALETCASEQCEILTGTPTMYVDMLNHPEFATYSRSIRSLKMAIFGGASALRPTMEQMRERFGLHMVHNGYGATETGGILSLTDYEKDPPEKYFTTCGRPVPTAEVKVVDKQGRVLPVGDVGEILVRGANVMKGYWEDKEGTQKAIDSSRWYWTGDLGKFDEQMYLQVSGRVKELVIRGGENIYPPEVEMFLTTHPAIADAHVIGVPDERMGEELCAFIKPRASATAAAIEGIPPPEHELSAASLKTYFTGKISHFKIPRYVVLTKSFPTTASGKVQKFKLFEIANKLKF